MQLDKVAIRLPIFDIEECVRIACQVAPRFRPQWKDQHLSSEVFTNGITNKVFSVYSSGDESDRLVFRVFGEGTDKIIDRPHELENWRLMSEHGLAAPLYATFENGIICGYLLGSPITKEMLRKEDIQREICAAMAALHAINANVDNATPCTFTKLTGFLANLERTFDYGSRQNDYDQIFGKVDFDEEFEQLKDLINSVDARISFCHNDLLLNNILYNQETGKISFIDYEYADANYELFDIGNHFNEWAGVDGVPDFDNCPNEDEKRIWFTTYYSTRNPDEDVHGLAEQSLKDVLLFEAASHFFWSVWSLVQAQNSSIDFDFLEYASSRYDAYRNKLAEYRKEK